MKKILRFLLLASVAAGCGGSDDDGDGTPVVESGPVFYRGTSEYALPVGNLTPGPEVGRDVLTVASVSQDGPLVIELFPSRTRRYAVTAKRVEEGATSSEAQIDYVGRTGTGTLTKDYSNGATYTFGPTGGGTILTSRLRRIALPKLGNRFVLQDGVYSGEVFLVTNESNQGRAGQANGWGLVDGRVQDGSFSGTLVTRSATTNLVLTLGANGAVPYAVYNLAFGGTALENPRWSGDGTSLVLTWKNATLGGSDSTVLLKRTGPVPTEG